MANMTIKEAFQKLSKVTNAGVKNPWFVIRNLGQTFADVADNVVDAGGSTVEVDPILESGTKIATISVDDDDYDLYAPSTSSQNYSTTEHVVGKWIDGTTDVYEKTYTSLNIEITQANTWVSTTLSATGIESFVDATMVDVNGQIMCGMVGFLSSKAYIGVTSSMTDRTLDTLTVRYTKVSS